MAVNCSLSLSATKENIWESLSLSLRNRSFGAVARMKLIGPAKTRLQRYVEEASSLPSSTVEEKMRVEEVIARINTNVSLLERCNRFKDLKTEEKVKEEEYQRVAEGYIEIRTNGGERARCPFRDSFESNC